MRQHRYSNLRQKLVAAPRLCRQGVPAHLSTTGLLVLVLKIDQIVNSTPAQDSLPRPKCLDHLDSVRWECTLELCDVKASKTSLSSVYGGAERGPRHAGARPPSILCMSMACINTAGVTQRTRTVRSSPVNILLFYEFRTRLQSVDLPRLTCRMSLESCCFPE